MINVPAEPLGSGEAVRETTHPTAVRAVWTLDGITFGIRMTEPTPEPIERGIKGRDDSMAWWDP